MNEQRRILRFWGRFLLLLAVALGAITLVMRWHRIFPSDEVSEIYAKYAEMNGIEASFIKDYRINDTAFIDATVLEATTDSAWTVLQKDFNIPIIPEEYRELFDSNNSICYWFASKNSFSAPADSIMPNIDFIVVSRHTRTICIFHITSESQITLILYKKIHQITQQEHEDQNHFRGTPRNTIHPFSRMFRHYVGGVVLDLQSSTGYYKDLQSSYIHNLS